ncbi:MAG: hypothetical protein QY325_07610 [Flavobacteriales bacterium]|nr:MAG: hypothetical protein QY325_07610 [Flavobacteriales bacterium]
MAAKTERERLEKVLLGQAELVQQVHAWLEEEQKRDDILRATLRSSRKQVTVDLPVNDPERVYTRDAIRALCIKYRLRFLEGGLFKGAIPGSAVLAMRDLEQRVGAPVTSYMVMAPSVQFRLCDSEVDPLLFVPLSDERYYLVARWGSDLAPWRAVSYWPVRSPVHLAATILLAALLCTALVPASWLGGGEGAYFTGQRILFLFWSVMAFSGFTTFGWFAFFGQFSQQAWNSRYFN